MRKSGTVNIDLDGGETINYTIKELTIKDIIELSQNNQFFKSEEAPTTPIEKSQNGQEPVIQKRQKGFLDELKEYSDEISEVMKKTCDFKLQDLIDNNLAPSEIKLLWDKFREVNQDFLDVLEKLKIIKLFSKMLEKHINNFSKILAIL